MDNTRVAKSSDVVPEVEPESIRLADQGIETYGQMMRFMSRLLGDTAKDRVPDRKARTLKGCCDTMLRIARQTQLNSHAQNGPDMPLISEPQPEQQAIPAPHHPQLTSVERRRLELLEELHSLGNGATARD